MNASDNALSPVFDIANALVGRPVEALQQVGGGRNSRVFHVRSAGREFALKQYPPREDDPRDRLATEVGALRLMERYHVDVVPRVLGVDASRGFALLSWVDGAQVDQIGDSDIDAAVTFLAAIHDLRTTPWALEQPLAAEACLCGSEIVSQIDGRLQRLQELPERDADLIDFLDNSFASAFAETVAKGRRELAAAGLDFALELPQKWRSLVPSDFGFHNSLRRGDGSLAFLDFEYFGWDDPVKLTADILLHPGRDLTPSLRQRFRDSGCFALPRRPELSEAACCFSSAVRSAVGAHSAERVYSRAVAA